jgi:hypothetical protein
MLTQAQIAENISWLMGYGSPAVRFLTHKHILGTNPDDESLFALWREVEASKEVVSIFANQQGDGSWCCGNPWAAKPSYIPAAGYSPFTPKFVTAVWVLSVLGDMGFAVSDPRIRKATDYVLRYQWESGLFDRFHLPQKRQSAQREDPSFNAPCELGIYLTSLGKIGMGQDPRLAKSYDLLLRWQREDGGWIAQYHKEERNWSRSCPAASHGAAMGLYYSGKDDCRDTLRRGLRFQTWHLALKGEDEIRTFFFHGHNTVKELLALSELGECLNERPVKVLLAWLAGMYRPGEGCFSFTGKRPTSASPGWMRYNAYHLLEDDWLTYYATRIAVNLQKSGH